VDNVKSQGFNVSFAEHLSVAKNAEAAENGHIFPFVGVCQRSVKHSRVALAAHLS
jgi:hypothetical protein